MSNFGKEEHSEGVCPRCKQEDSLILTSQEVSHIVQIPELEQGPYTYTETLLVSVRCSCGYAGYARFPIEDFAGYITDEEIEEMDALDEKRGDDFMADVRDGKVCFGCEAVPSECDCRRPGVLQNV